MRTLSGLGKLKGLLLALPLVPAFFALEHVGLEGFPEALGCSGAGAVAPLPAATVLNPHNAATVPIATDGFLLLTTTGYLGPDPTQTVQVTVTTADGQVVPGKLASLENGMLSWQADAALPIGTKLTATTGTTGAPGGATTNLEVVGEPTTLGTPELLLGDWIDFRHGVGDPVSCTRDIGACGSPMITFPGTEQSLHAVHAGWKSQSPIHGFVAWQALVQLRSGRDLIGLAAPQYLYVDDPATATVPLGSLVFPDATTDYCAVLVVRDLRTGLEQKSELCAEPGAPTATERDTPLYSCSAPPTPEDPALTRAWCELHPAAAHAACVGVGGGSGNPLNPPEDDVSPDLEPNEPLPDAMAPDASARTSSGCQLAPGVGSSASVGALLAALALSVVRRRRLA